MAVDIRAFENSVPIDLYPALSVLGNAANKTTDDTFKMGEEWKSEIAAIAKAEFKFKINGKEHVDNVIKYSEDHNGDLTVKFSPYLPQDGEEEKQYAYDYKKPEYVKQQRQQPSNDILSKDAGGPVRITKGVVNSIIKADTEKRLVYGIVLEPNSVDLQGDTIKAETIEAAAHQYLVKSRVIGAGHAGKADASISESWIAPEDFTYEGQDIKKGTWLMTVKINNDILWDKVKNGTYQGFSIGGTGLRVPMPYAG